MGDVAKQIQELKDFLKEAFCTDGEVTFLGSSQVLNNNTSIDGQSFELSDSKRGKFIVTLSKSLTSDTVEGCTPECDETCKNGCYAHMQNTK